MKKKTPTAPVYFVAKSKIQQSADIIVAAFRTASGDENSTALLAAGRIASLYEIKDVLVVGGVEYVGAGRQGDDGPAADGGWERVIKTICDLCSRTCDLCSRAPRWRHPEGGLRCAKCPRPGAAINASREGSK